MNSFKKLLMLSFGGLLAVSAAFMNNTIKSSVAFETNISQGYYTMFQIAQSEGWNDQDCITEFTYEGVYFSVDAVPGSEAYYDGLDDTLHLKTGNVVTVYSTVPNNYLDEVRFSGGSFINSEGDGALAVNSTSINSFRRSYLSRTEIEFNAISFEDADLAVFDVVNDCYIESIDLEGYANFAPRKNVIEKNIYVINEELDKQGYLGDDSKVATFSLLSDPTVSAKFKQGSGEKISPGEGEVRVSDNNTLEIYAGANVAIVAVTVNFSGINGNISLPNDSHYSCVDYLSSDAIFNIVHDNTVLQSEELVLTFTGDLSIDMITLYTTDAIGLKAEFSGANAIAHFGNVSSEEPFDGIYSSGDIIYNFNSPGGSYEDCNEYTVYNRDNFTISATDPDSNIMSVLAEFNDYGVVTYDENYEVVGPQSKYMEVNDLLIRAKDGNEQNSVTFNINGETYFEDIFIVYGKIGPNITIDETIKSSLTFDYFYHGDYTIENMSMGIATSFTATRYQEFLDNDLEELGIAYKFDGQVDYSYEAIEGAFVENFGDAVEVDEDVATAVTNNHIYQLRLCIDNIDAANFATEITVCPYVKLGSTYICGDDVVLSVARIARTYVSMHPSDPEVIEHASVLTYLGWGTTQIPA